MIKYQPILIKLRKLLQKKTKKELKNTNPIRLGLSLIFFYEVKNDIIKACQLAKQNFDDVIVDIGQIDGSIKKYHHY